MFRTPRWQAGPLLALGLLIATVASAVPSVAGTPVTVGNFADVPMPYGFGSPTAFAVASDGTMWIGTDDGLYRRAGDGTVTEPFDDNHAIYSVAVAPDSDAWFITSGQIWRADPGGAVTDLDPIANEAAARELTITPDGHIWFVHGYNGVTELNASGAVLTTLTAGNPLGEPSNVTHDGSVVWFTTLGTTDDGGTVGKIVDGAITEFSIPGPYVGDITVAPTGGVWFGQYTDPPSLTRISPAGHLTRHPLPTGSIGGIAGDEDGRLWFTDAETDRIWSFTLGTDAFHGYTGAPVDAPGPIVVDLAGDVWWGNDGNGGGLARTNRPQLLPTGPGSRFHPLRDDAFIVWERARNNDPATRDVFAREPGGVAFQVNPQGTSATLGGLDGTTLAYQVVTGTSKDIAMVDLATREGLDVPDGINTKAEEYAPSISGDRILFGRVTRAGKPQMHVYLYAPSLADGSGPVISVKVLGLSKGTLMPNDIAGDWIAWTMCQDTCDVFTRNEDTDGTYKVNRTAGNYDLFGASVTADGYIYVVRSKRSCDTGPLVMGGETPFAGDVIASLPAGTSTTWTSDWTSASGMVLLYDQTSCLSGNGTPMQIQDLFI